MAQRMREKKWKFDGLRWDFSIWSGIIVFQGDWSKVNIPKPTAAHKKY